MTWNVPWKPASWFADWLPCLSFLRLHELFLDDSHIHSNVWNAASSMWVLAFGVRFFWLFLYRRIFSSLSRSLTISYPLSDTMIAFLILMAIMQNNKYRAWIVENSFRHAIYDFFRIPAFRRVCTFSTAVPSFLSYLPQSPSKTYSTNLRSPRKTFLRVVPR